MALQLEFPRQKLLKDFLQENNNNNLNNSLNSSYTNDINNNILSQDSATAATVTATVTATTLQRSRSNSRAKKVELLFGKLLNAVKSLHSSSGGGRSTPLTLPRSVSRRLWSTVKRKKEKKSKCSSEVMNRKIVVVTVRVKDILRWKSFRDLGIDDNFNYNTNDNDIISTNNCQINVNDDGVDRDDEVYDESQPLDGVVGPTIDDDNVEGEELPCWLVGENLDEVDEVGIALDTHVGPQKDNHNMESEEDVDQQSPVSVLKSPFRDEVSDNEEFVLSSFDQSLANMERTKQRLLQSIQLFETLAGVHEEDELDEDEEVEDELEPRVGDIANEAKNKAYLCKGLCWFRRGSEGFEAKIECIEDMDELRNWGKFEEGRTELSIELEVGVLSDLVDEVLIDFFGLEL